MIYPMVAAGNIAPSRFVMQSTAADNKVLEATSAAKLIGVSQRGTRNTPLTGWEDSYAAIAGESLQVYSDTETCMIELGGTVSPGDRLGATTNGKAIAVTSGEYGAIASQAGTSGKLIECVVELGAIS